MKPHMLSLPVSFSIHVASHVEVWSLTIAFQFPSGTQEFSPRFKAILRLCWVSIGLAVDVVLFPWIGLEVRPANSLFQLSHHQQLPYHKRSSCSRSIFLDWDMRLLSSRGRFLNRSFSSPFNLFSSSTSRCTFDRSNSEILLMDLNLGGRTLLRSIMKFDSNSYPGRNEYPSFWTRHKSILLSQHSTDIVLRECQQWCPSVYILEEMQFHCVAMIAI